MKKVVLGLIGALILLSFSNGCAFAASDCRDVEFVFVRGSGATRNNSDE